MRIGIIGKGAREHALGTKLQRDMPMAHIYVAPGDPGWPASVRINDFSADTLSDFIEEHRLEYLILGHGEPCVSGVSDALQHLPCKVFGPGGASGRLEGDKVFAKEFMARAGIPTARSFQIHTEDEWESWVLGEGWPWVLKYSGGGDGSTVHLCRGPEEAVRFRSRLSVEEPFFPVLVEEVVIGGTVSISGFCDGFSFAPLLATHDYKPDYNPRKTGFRDTHADAAVGPARLSAEMMTRINEDIVQRTLLQLQKEDIPYCGVLRFGVMITRTGPILLEYTCTLGDSEACVQLGALATPLLDVVDACLERRLSEVRLEMHPGYLVDAVSTVGQSGEKTREGKVIRLSQLNRSSRAIKGAARQSSSRTVGTVGRHALNVLARGDAFGSSRQATYYASAPSLSLEEKQLDVGHLKTSVAEEPCKKICVLISGNGTNAVAITSECESGILRGFARISLVISNRAEAPGLEMMKERGVSTRLIPSKNMDRETFEAQLTQTLHDEGIDLVVLAGFDRVLSARFLDSFDKRVLNIHPADPTVFRGLDGYHWAFAEKLETTKITVHLLESSADGGKILAQENVDLHGVSTLGEVEKRCLPIEHDLYSKAIRSYLVEELSHHC